MEPAFGDSFEDVRLHDDATARDHELLAHELTHVVQQRSGVAGVGSEASAAGSESEVEAASVARRVASGGAAPEVTSQPAGLHRAVDWGGLGMDALKRAAM